MKLMKELYPCLFDPNVQKADIPRKIKWSKIAYEFNKNTNLTKDFKNYKQIKERWNNHLNPYLNKY